MLISTLVMGVAFAIWLSGGFDSFYEPRSLLEAFVICFLTISLGFALHELGHRVVARKHRLNARFQMWVPGLLLALGFALFSSGFIFLAPGAVATQPCDSPVPAPRGVTGTRNRCANPGYGPTKKQMGVISIAGPSMNVILALIFLGIAFFLINFSPVDLSSYIGNFFVKLCLIGAYLNAFMAMFNMIPIPPFDGNKIFNWSKYVWVGFTAVTVGIYFLCRI